MAYKVLFVDEEREQHDHFLDYMDAANDVTVECILPAPSLQEMIQIFDERKPDAIVSDYLLNDIKDDVDYNIPYTGSELISEYRKHRPNFPCFIITSHDDDAVGDSDDVNLIYVKFLLTGDESNVKVKFYNKIIEQINKYHNFIIEAQQKLTSLLNKKRAEGLEPTETERLVELDGFLEKSLDTYETLPADMKKSENLDKLSSLVEKIDSLLSKM